MKKVAVIGYGYVGKAVFNFFQEHFYLTIVDPLVAYGPEIDQKQLANEADLAVVCVPTPMGDDGSVDLSAVREVFSWLKVPLVLVKSTVPPGTIEQLEKEYPNLNIAFSPEFIGEGKYQVQWWKDKGYPHPTDMKYHDFQIFGGRKEVTTKIIPFFQKVVGPEPKMIQTNSRTAELCKYMENSWGATKVIFCHSFAKMADAMGIDYNELRELWLLDGRVERMHTAYFPDAPGFGGKCFPKDVNGIVKASEKAGFDPKILKAVLEVNKELRNDLS